MRRFQSILYVTRGMPEESAALEQALSLARNNGAAVHAVAFSPSLPKNLGEYEASYEASLTERIKASVAEAQAALKMSTSEVRVTAEVECGDTPAVRIVRRVLRNAHDLLIKPAEPSERRAGFRALDMQLLRSCPCPLWLSRPISRSRADIRVAVAIDPQSSEPAGRDLALKLLQLSRSIADTCSGKLDILSCWDLELEDDLRHSPWAKMPEEAIQSSIASAEKDHRTALDELIQESGIAGRSEVHHPRGVPEQTIPQLVDTLEVDILVMGTVARTGIPGFIIGNTAENVLREVQCSLLALKPNGFVSPIKAY